MTLTYCQTVFFRLTGLSDSANNILSQDPTSPGMGGEEIELFIPNRLSHTDICVEPKDGKIPTDEDFQQLEKQFCAGRGFCNRINITWTKNIAPKNKIEPQDDNMFDGLSPQMLKKYLDIINFFRPLFNPLPHKHFF